MRVNRFFTDRLNLTLNSSVKLADSDIRHIRNVLRMKKGDEIVLFNGEKEYLAELKIVSRDFVTVKIKRILKVADFSETSGVEITLFQSLIRTGNFDFVLEKATEIGIDAIVPMETEFSQIKIDIAEKKTSRWSKIIIAALKQSQRIKVPEMFQPISFKDALELKDKFDLVFFFTIARDNIKESGDTINLKKFIEDQSKVVEDKAEISAPKKIAYFIGPEGGFSPTEHKLAKAAGFTFVQFGNTVLRSETASIAILSVLKYIYS